MTPEEAQKVEMTLVLMCHKLPSRQMKKEVLRKIGCSWEEYKHLRQKYSRGLERYDQEKEKNKWKNHNVLQ
jgi:hypothetical protein